MPNKPQPTTRRSRTPRLGLARQDSGLIVTATPAKQSAGTKCPLDNRSHRTPELTCGRVKRERMRSIRNP